MEKTTVTLTRSGIEFTPARHYRDALEAEGQAAGSTRLLGWTVIDGRRLNLSVRWFAAPTDGEPAVGRIILHTEDEIRRVRLTTDGVPLDVAF